MDRLVRSCGAKAFCLFLYFIKSCFYSHSILSSPSANHQPQNHCPSCQPPSIGETKRQIGQEPISLHQGPVLALHWRCIWHVRVSLLHLRLYCTCTCTSCLLCGQTEIKEQHKKKRQIGITMSYFPMLDLRFEVGLPPPVNGFLVDISSIQSK